MHFMHLCGCDFAKTESQFFLNMPIWDFTRFVGTVLTPFCPLTLDYIAADG